MCLLGPLEYVKTPVIVLRERKPIPNDNPMYADEPITMKALLTAGGLRRWKCWTVLLIGCYYLMRIRGVGLTGRVGAVGAHISAFSQRYRTKLAKELVFETVYSCCWAREVGVASRSPMVGILPTSP